MTRRYKVIIMASPAPSGMPVIDENLKTNKVHKAKNVQFLTGDT